MAREQRAERSTSGPRSISSITRSSCTDFWRLAGRKRPSTPIEWPGSTNWPTTTNVRLGDAAQAPGQDNIIGRHFIITSIGP